MNHAFWQALGEMSLQGRIFFAFALFVAFAFEFINGFHDTANAVTTVIYTRTLRATPAVLYSGICNFLGVLLGGTAVAFAIVNLLPVDLLIESASTRAIVMVVSLLLAGVIWNLGTWWLGLPVSSSHTLIGSILGVGLANSLLTRGNVTGVNWHKAGDVGLSLLISPLVGFVAAGLLLLVMRRLLRDPRLFLPPGEGEEPPRWIRGVLLVTCGGVSFAHGSNDGQKGMGLILLALIGFMPTYYALDMENARQVPGVLASTQSVKAVLEKEAGEHSLDAKRLVGEIEHIDVLLASASAFADLPANHRWEVRRSILRLIQGIGESDVSPETKAALAPALKSLRSVTEFVPLWVVVGVAVALGVGTTIGYKRIVVTVAEKIGKSHMTYAQGAAAEMVAAATIGLADAFHLPVSTTHVLSSGVAGTMWANRSGLQAETVRKIGIAWALTLPAALVLAATLFTVGGWIIPGAAAMPGPRVDTVVPAVAIPVAAEPARAEEVSIAPGAAISATH